MNGCRNAAHVIGECFGMQLEDDTPDIFLTPDEERFGATLRRNQGDYIVVHTTTNRVQKNWPTEYWDALVRSMPHRRILQVGGDADERVPSAADYRGLAIRYSFAVVKYARVFVGVDSVMQHAAAAFGVPAVVLFGPSPPAVFGHGRAVNITAPNCVCHRDVSRWTVCDVGCMRQIPPQEVVRAIQALGEGG
jgi:ADP-heptose:LPS heptosyltransferase